MGIAKSSLLFATGTMISRLTGLLRDRIVLSVFGASDLHDAFLIAYKIPNLLRDMVAEGALGNSFTKVYSSLCAVDRKRATALLVDSLFLMTMIGLIICLLGVLGAPYLVQLVTMMAHADERSPQFFSDAIGLTRILFPFLAFMILASITMGALHQRGQFFLSGISPVALNVGTIIGALWISKAMASSAPLWVETVFASRAVTGLAIGVLLGGLAQFLVQFIGLWRPVLKGALTFPRKFPWSADIKEVVILMAPMVIAASAAQVKVVINLIFATGLQEGAVTWLNYAFRLLQLPIGLFGVAIGAAVLPSLARSITRAGGKVDQTATVELQKAIDLVLWVMVICLVFLLHNSLGLVQLLFQSGAFGADDVDATAAALYAYSYGLIGYGLIKVLTSFYFAVNRTSYAMKASITTIFINVGANYLLIDTWGHVGLAYALSLTLLFNALLLILGLLPEKLAFDRSNIMKSLVLLVVAGVLSMLAQKLCQPAIAGLDWVLSSPIWLKAGIEMLFNGVMVCAIFIVFVLIRLQLSPAQAYRQLLDRLLGR